MGSGKRGGVDVYTVAVDSDIDVYVYMYMIMEMSGIPNGSVHVRRSLVSFSPGIRAQARVGSVGGVGGLDEMCW